MTSTSGPPKVSFRIDQATKEAAMDIAKRNGYSLAEMVKAFLAVYVVALPRSTRDLPSTKGARTVSVRVGTKLATAAREAAARKNEDLSRPIVEFLNATVEQGPDADITELMRFLA